MYCEIDNAKFTVFFFLRTVKMYTQRNFVNYNACLECLRNVLKREVSQNLEWLIIIQNLCTFIF